MKKRKHHNAEQIARILKQADGPQTILEVCQEHNISEQTFHRWKKKYRGMELAEIKRMKALEKENAELKKMIADTLLENRALRAVNEKNGKPAAQEKSCSIPCGRAVAFGEAGLRDASIE